MSMLIEVDPEKASKKRHDFNDAPIVEDGLDTSALIIDGDI